MHSVSIVPKNLGHTLYLKSLLSQNSWEAEAVHTPTNKHRTGWRAFQCVRLCDGQPLFDTITNWKAGAAHAPTNKHRASWLTAFQSVRLSDS